MKVAYRGFDIDVTKGPSMAGYKLTYYSVFRKSDGYEMTSGYSDDADTVRTWIKMMKSRVDGFIADPSEEVLQDNWDTNDEYAEQIAKHRLENEKTQRLQ